MKKFNDRKKIPTNEWREQLNQQQTVIAKSIKLIADKPL